MECDWVHLVCRALFGLLYQPRMIDDDECGAAGGMRIGRGNQSAVLGENIPWCQFAHRNSNMTWRGLEPKPLLGEASD
jgi:hypothetical protein